MPTILSFILILGLSVSSAAGFAQQSDGRSSDDPSLWIEVRDENGLPLKHACITVVPKEGEIVFRKADARGRVRIKDLTRGHYRITAKSDGYALQKKEVEFDATAETVTFSLQPRNY